MKFGFDLKKKPVYHDDPNYVFGISPEADLNVLIDDCKTHLVNFNEGLIRKAFKTCLDAHKDKLRKSGEPFYTHPLAVARIVMREIPLDDVSVAAALLHNVVDEGVNYSMQDLRNEFGPVVAQIVDGISKIKYVESRHINSVEQMESYRRLLLALFKDVRIILIKLADRLHNMRTVDHLTEESQQRAANETMEIYAPFANRFGLRNIKWELEDLAFKFTNREAYDSIKASLNQTREERDVYIEKFVTRIHEALQKDEMLKKLKLKYEVAGRAKHIYSIFNKTILRQKPIEELYDLFAIRIILDTNDPYMCFYVYGIVAAIYPPVPETFKDYISSQKKNGYQSIHTAVLGNDNRPVEVQIRTKQMHEISEKGVAAHFKYKRGRVDSHSVMEDQNVQSWMDVVREIFENAGNELTPELLDAVRGNLFQEEIYVFTPDNEFRTLPKDSTVVDFAFAIHSALGFKCIGAKINGKVAPPDYKLKNGDQVEVLTSKNQKPSREWLSFIVTGKASQTLHKYFRDEDKKMESLGKEIWQTKIVEHSFALSDEEFESLIKSLNFTKDSDFFRALGANSVNLMKVYDFIRFKVKDAHKKQTETIKNIINNQGSNGAKFIMRPFKKIKIDPDMSIEFGDCCKPLPGEKIYGVKNGPDEITVHYEDCPVLAKTVRTHSDDIVEIDWQDLDEKDFVADLFILGDDREFLLQDITKAIIESGHTNIYSVKLDTKDSVCECNISIKADNTCRLDALFEKILQIPGIRSVDRPERRAKEE